MAKPTELTHMTMLSKRTLLLALVIGVFGIAGGMWLRRSDCPGAGWVNFEVTCRVLDVRPDNTTLIESFDPDTNDLRLYLRHDGKYRQIEHPYGKVKNFKAAVRENVIRFNPVDNGSVLVNGEVFPITQKG